MVIITIQIDEIGEAIMIKHDCDISQAEGKEEIATRLVIAGLAEMGIISPGGDQTASEE